MIRYAQLQALSPSLRSGLMNFSLDKEKAVEALIYVARAMPGVGRFHACKALYFAEWRHLRTYGRPIFGDRYIAMDNGPVPSFGYNVLKGTTGPDDRQLAAGALEPVQGSHFPTYRAGRAFRDDLFSQSDIECLDWAIGHCRGRRFGEISDETHEHPAWNRANLNAPMDYADFFDGVDPAIVEEAEAFASYGVL